jgi:hypothetical protein
MDTKTLDRIRALRTEANNLDGFDKSWERIKSDSNIDKKGFGFNADNRFSSFKATVSFDSWQGAYGSSSCGTMFHCNAEVAREFLVKALDAHRESIFETMAALMRKESKTLLEKAHAEIETMKSMLRDCEGENS